MDTRTPGQRAYDEHKRVRQANARAGLGNKSASNESVVNNTDVSGVDSQGVPFSLALRATPDVSFDLGTQEIYEQYSGNDILSTAEDLKRPGSLGNEAMTYKP